jgi:hypothetical protein
LFRPQRIISLKELLELDKTLNLALNGIQETSLPDDDKKSFAARKDQILRETCSYFIEQCRILNRK